MSVNKFKEEQIPYQKLAKYGLNKNMIDDLPMDVLTLILNGQRTPVLPVEMKDSEGNRISSRARFSLYSDEKGEVNVRFYPVFGPIEDKVYLTAVNPKDGTESLQDVAVSTLFSEQVLEKLKEGKVVLDYKPQLEGKRVKAFLQLDKETNQILSVPCEGIARNIREVSDDFNLSDSEEICLLNGGMITFVQDERMVSVGVDLNSPTGIRFAEGDEKTWKNQSKREWGKYNIGVFGCWVMGDDGELSYINEEDYSDEMWDEIERQRNMRRASQGAGRSM